MKKLFVLFVLLASFAMAQSQLVSVRFSSLVQAAAQSTADVPLGDWSRIDSIGLTLAGYGELDIDSVDVFVGTQIPGVGAFYFATAYTFLSALDIAAATKGWTNAVGVTAVAPAPTVLTSAVMRGGINILRVKVRAAATTGSGNYLYCIFRIWGVPKGGT